MRDDKGRGSSARGREKSNDRLASNHRLKRQLVTASTSRVFGRPVDSMSPHSLQVYSGPMSRALSWSPRELTEMTVSRSGVVVSNANRRTDRDAPAEHPLSSSTMTVTQSRMFLLGDEMAQARHH